MANGKASKLRRVSFVVDAADADVMGDEPIWAKVSTDYGTVEKPHGYGAPRFDETGKEVRGSKAAQGASGVRGIVDGEWRVVGWITSGGYAHYVQKSMAQGYVPAALAENESADMFEIEVDVYFATFERQVAGNFLGPGLLNRLTVFERRLLFFDRGY